MITSYSRLAGIALLGLATLSHAAAPDPYPDQPGVLSSKEIQAATEAMQAVAAGEAGYQLIASGHPKGFGRFALFAKPFVAYSDRARTRSQVICTNVGGPWNCDKNTTVRVTKDGVEQQFIFHFARDAAQAAVDIVDFLYSPCFSARYATIGGKPFTPSPVADYINGASDGGKVFNVFTGPAGGWVSYQLEKTDKGADGCGFRILEVKTAATGVMLPKERAKEVERQAVADGARRAEARQRASIEDTITLAGYTMTRDDLVGYLMLSAIAGGIIAIIVPLLFLLAGVRFAAVAAGTLSLITTVLFVAAEHFYNPGQDIRLDLVIIPPLLLVSWALCVVYALKATAGKGESRRQLRLALWAVLLAFVIFPILGFALGFIPGLDTVAKILFLWPMLLAQYVFRNTLVVFLLTALLQLAYCYAIVLVLEGLKNGQTGKSA